MAHVVKVIVRDLIIVKVCLRGDGSLSSWQQWHAGLLAEVVTNQGEPVVDGRANCGHAKVEVSLYHNAFVKMKATAKQTLQAFGGQGYDTQTWMRERACAKSIGSIYHWQDFGADDAAGLWLLFRHVRKASAGYRSKHSRHHQVVES